MNCPGRLAIASMQPHCSPEEWQARIGKIPVSVA